MTNKDFKEGMEVTCVIGGTRIDDAKLHQIRTGDWFVCQNIVEPAWDELTCLDRQGYRFAVHINCISNIQPKPRTIDDLEEGDYVDRVGGCKRKCLAVCGNVYFMSEENNDDEYGIGFTIGGLKRCRYTLYQPDDPKEESDIDKCIKVVEEYSYGGNCFTIKVIKEGIVQALKNLKK